MYAEDILEKWKKAFFLRKNIHTLLPSHSLICSISQYLLSSNSDQTLPDIQYHGEKDTVPTFMGLIFQTSDRKEVLE